MLLRDGYRIIYRISKTDEFICVRYQFNRLIVGRSLTELEEMARDGVLNANVRWFCAVHGWDERQLEGDSLLASFSYMREVIPLLERQEHELV